MAGFMRLTDRRTFVVLASLIGSMTLASGVLMLLKPGGSSSSRLLSLSAVGEPGIVRDDPLETSAKLEPGRWLAIVIHDSGLPSGSARTLDERHRRAGLGGLGYHFVIGNGHGSGDGQLETGRRWREQLDGAHSGGPRGRWYNEHAIGICLVGDGDRSAPTSAQLEQLVRLVRQLQSRLGIAAENVRLRYGSSEVSQRGRFPAAWLQRQLLRIER